MSDDAHHKLAKSISDVDKKVDRLGASFTRKFNKFEKNLMEKLEPLFTDYTGRSYVAKSKITGINIDPRIFDIVKWLVFIIVAIVGADKVTGE